MGVHRSIWDPRDLFGPPGLYGTHWTIGDPWYLFGSPGLFGTPGTHFPRTIWDPGLILDPHDYFRPPDLFGIPQNYLGPLHIEIPWTI